MASTHKSLRSGTANKRPTTSIADGQIALNTNTTSPGLFFKDSTGATIIKVGPVHVGTTAPNASPAAGGSAGNSVGEIWLDTSLTPVGVKIWNGSAFVNATPIGSTTVQGLLELATSAETQTGTDTDRAVTPAGLQSKVSDSTSTTSSTTIASSTAVKSAYDLANAALPKSGGTVTGNLEIGTTGSLSFEGATADAFETTIAVTDPTADRTITLPDTTGTVVTTGDTGTVTSTMILDGTIVNGDINASAAIAHTKLANITAGSVLMGNASNVPTATALSGDVTIDSSGVTAISSGVIVNADVNASAAIAGTKISPDFGSQNRTSTGTSTAASFIPTSSTAPSNGVYLPAANNVAISTNGTGRLFVNANGRVGVNTDSPSHRLHVVGGNGSGNTTIGCYGGTSAGDYGLLILGNGSTDKASVNVDATTNDLRIDLRGNNGAFTFVSGPSYTERMRLDSSGRLGLGTSSADNKLSVGIASADEGIELKATYNGARVARFGILNPGVDNTPYIGSVSGNDFGFITSGTRRMTLDAAGRLGIGTTSPGSALDVVGNARVSGAYSWSDYANTIYHGITAPAADVIAFRGGGSERARIDSSGRLLVGTSSSRTDYKLQVEGTASSNGWGSFVHNSNDSTGAIFKLLKSRGTAVGSNTVVQSGDSLGRIDFDGADGSTNQTAATIRCDVDGTPGAGDMPGRLVFSTTADGASSPTERMRIANTGYIWAYSTSAGFLQNVSAGAGTSTALFIGNRSATATDGSGGTTVYYVWSNGNVQNTNNSYTGISDAKLKENIVDASSQWSDIKALKVRKYNFKEETGQETHTQIGLVAQEVEQISPGLVFETPDRDADGNETGEVTKGVNYSVLYMKAVKALQEAMERIETLEAKVAALEAA